MTIAELKNAFIVSCQPLPGSPMDKPEIIVAMASAAVVAGARGVRIEGTANVRAVRQALPYIPLIGIVKRDLADSPVRITPLLEDVQSLAAAGASVIAFDGTARPRPVDIVALIREIRQYGCAAMADCSNLEDGLHCLMLGCDLIGTTLSGYTEATADQAMDQPDLELIRKLTAAGAQVMAEGRIRTPEQAAAAASAGAFCITVGSALTRIEHITGWFLAAINQAYCKH